MVKSVLSWVEDGLGGEDWAWPVVVIGRSESGLHHLILVSGGWGSEGDGAGGGDEGGDNKCSFHI